MYLKFLISSNLNIATKNLFYTLCGFSLSFVLATSVIAAHQVPLSVEFFQAQTLEWVAISYSRGSFRPRNQTRVSVSPGLAGSFFTTAPPGSH